MAKRIKDHGLLFVTGSLQKPFFEWVGFFDSMTPPYSLNLSGTLSTETAIFLCDNIPKVLMDFWCDPDDDSRRPCLSGEEVANNMCVPIPSPGWWLEHGYHRGGSGLVSAAREDKAPSSSLSPPDP